MLRFTLITGLNLSSHLSKSVTNTKIQHLQLFSMPSYYFSSSNSNSNSKDIIITFKAILHRFSSNSSNNNTSRVNSSAATITAMLSI